MAQDCVVAGLDKEYISVLAWPNIAAARQICADADLKTPDEIVRKAGLLSELPPAAKARAARWRALPEEERKRILDEFYNLKLDKSLKSSQKSEQRLK